MKKFLVLLLVLVLAFSFIACKSGNNSAADNGNNSSNNGENNSNDDKNKPKDKFESPSDMLGEQNRLVSIFEKTLNDYNNIDLQLALIITGGTLSMNMSQLLNVMGENGKFGDLNSSQGYYEKFDELIKIGKDYIVHEDKAGFNQAGDRLLEQGEANLDTGVLWTEESTERDGVTIKRNRYDYLFSGGKMTAMVQSASDMMSTEEKSNSAVFVIISDTKYEFVTGKMEIESAEGSLKDLMVFNSNMSIAEAKAMLGNYGYIIKYYGKIEGDVVTML